MARRRARIRLAISAGLFAASVTLLVVVARGVSADMYQSGSFQYFSLIFSDGGTVLASWKEFLLTFVESIPTLGVAAALASIFVALASLKFSFRNWKPSFLPAQA